MSYGLNSGRSLSLPPRGDYADHNIHRTRYKHNGAHYPAGNHSGHNRADYRHHHSTDYGSTYSTDYSITHHACRTYPMYPSVRPVDHHHRRHLHR